MHNINIENGKAAIAYNVENGPPWHGLGTSMKGKMTSQEGIVAAHLDFEVELLPVYALASKEDKRVYIPDKFATVRMDTMQALGVVGKKYTPLQNIEAFEFFDRLVGTGEAIYEVCGALGRGETVWILAELPGELRIEGTDDVTKKYLLLTNTHDGSRSVRVFYTPVRVVCFNTLSMAISRRKKGEGIAIRHFPGVKEKVNEARKVLGLAIKQYDVIGKVFNALNKHNWNGDRLETYVNRVFPPSKEKEEGREDEISTRLRNIRQDVVNLFDSPQNRLPGIRGTAWAAYNSVTQYVDHYRTTYKTEDRTRKLRSIWFGNGAIVKERALDIALEEIGLPPIAMLN